MRFSEQIQWLLITDIGIVLKGGNKDMIDNNNKLLHLVNVEKKIG